MFSRKAKRERPARRTAADRAAERAREGGGYSGIEGDFESERRRAAEASHETIEPYEHGENDPPVLPASAPGLTHP